MEILSFGLLIIIMLGWTMAITCVSKSTRNNRYI